ncbi:COPII coat assembly protein SEC16 Ecym_7056 [Eremothecium cymbalariae DBVPG|uniref:Protein transport protein sec16 n=1 Tax=Eremothecium cymbalariae (strain CBS 270.75 / DBVPG 7215 / KCTC 17166 / NRRL Y-17582) TaxID=931890 RepID=G8JVP4_ERECY|nr:hypothetical protein Ecym_7056 [Eremothecium cymbalariae DBVPG\
MSTDTRRRRNQKKKQKLKQKKAERRLSERVGVNNNEPFLAASSACELMGSLSSVESNGAQFTEGMTDNEIADDLKVLNTEMQHMTSITERFRSIPEVPSELEDVRRNEHSEVIQDNTSPQNVKGDSVDELIHQYGAPTGGSNLKIDIVDFAQKTVNVLPVNSEDHQVDELFAGNTDDTKMPWDDLTTTENNFQQSHIHESELLIDENKRVLETTSIAPEVSIDSLFDEPTSHIDFLKELSRPIESTTNGPKIYNVQIRPAENVAQCATTKESDLDHGDTLFGDASPSNLPWEQPAEDSKEPSVLLSDHKEDSNGNGNKHVPIMDELFSATSIQEKIPWKEADVPNTMKPASVPQEHHDNNKQEANSDEAVKKFSFLDDDDDLLKDEDEQEDDDNGSNKSGDISEAQDDDSFLDSDEELPSVSQVGGSNSYLPKGPGPGFTQSMQNAQGSSYSVNSHTTSAYTATMPKQSIISSISTPETQKNMRYAPLVQASIQPYPQQTVLQGRPNIFGTDPQDQSLIKPVPHESIRKLEEEKKKSDAYDFPLDLVKKNEKQSARPVGVPSGVNSLVTSPRVSAPPPFLSMGPVKQLHVDQTLGQEKPAVPVIPIKNPYQPISETSTPALTPLVAGSSHQKTLSTYSNIYAPVPNTPLSQNTSENSYVTSGAVPPPPKLFVQPGQPQQSGPYGLMAHQNTNKNVLSPPSQNELPKDRRSVGYGMTSRARATSNASVSSIGSYGTQANPYTLQANQQRIQFPQNQMHLPQPVPALQTLGLGVNAGSAAPSPSTQKRTHARSNSSIYAPAQAPHASKYAPTVHPHYQQKYQVNNGSVQKGIPAVVPYGRPVVNIQTPATDPAPGPVQDNYELSRRQFPIFNWSQTAKIVYAMPANPNSSDFIVQSNNAIKNLTVCNFDSVLKPDIALREFPGPLVRGKTRRKDVVKWLELKMKFQQEQHAGKNMLLLAVLKQKLENHAALKEFSKVLYDSEQLLPYLTQPNQTSRTAPNAFKLEASSQLHILASLQTGSPDAALDLALSQKDFALALVLSSLLGRETWASVVDRYLHEEFNDSTFRNPFSVHLLAFVFQVFAGNSKRILQELTTDPVKGNWSLQYWNMILAAILNNINNSSEAIPIPPVVIEFLVGFGVYLIQHNQIEAGIICFVIANVPLSQNEVIPQSGVNFASLGSINSLDAILLSEVYEFSYVTENEQLTHFPTLLYSKAVHAATLLDYGFATTISKYVDVITNSMRNLAKNTSLSIALSNRLELINVRLSGITTGWLGKPKFSSVWGQLDKSFNKFIAGDSDDSSKQHDKTVFDNFTPNASRNASTLDLNHSFTPMRPPVVGNASIPRSHSELPLSNKNTYAPHSVNDNHVISSSRIAGTASGNENVNTPMATVTDGQVPTLKMTHSQYNPSNHHSPRNSDDSHGFLDHVCQAGIPSPANCHTRNSSIPHAVTPPPIFSAPPKKQTCKYETGTGSTLSVDQQYLDRTHSGNSPPKPHSNPTVHDMNITPAKLAAMQTNSSMTDFFAPPPMNVDSKQSGKPFAHGILSHSIPSSSRQSSTFSEVPPPPKKSGSGVSTSPRIKKSAVNYAPSNQYGSLVSQPISAKLQNLSDEADVSGASPQPGSVGETPESSSVGLGDNTVIHTSPVYDKRPQASVKDANPSPTSMKRIILSDQDETFKDEHLLETRAGTTQDSASTIIKYFCDDAPNESITDTKPTQGDFSPGATKSTSVINGNSLSSANLPSKSEHLVNASKNVSKYVEKHVPVSNPYATNNNSTSALSSAHPVSNTSSRRSSINPYMPKSLIDESFSGTTKQDDPEGFSKPSFGYKLSKFGSRDHIGSSVSEPIPESEHLMSPVLAHPVPRTSRFEPIREIYKNEEDSFRSDKVPVIRAASNPNFNPYTPSASEQYYDDVVEDESDDDDEQNDDEKLKREMDRKQEVERKKEKEAAASKAASEKPTTKSQANDTRVNSGTRWFGWLKKDTTEKKPIRAKLGQKNNFYYDEKLKRWVNKDAGEEEILKVSTPPPPPPVVKRKINNTPEIKPRSGSIVGGPAVRTHGAVAPINPQTGECIASTSAPSPSLSPVVPSRQTSSTISLSGKSANGLDDLISLTSGPSSAVSRRKKKPGRGYVNVLNNL